MDQQPVTFSSSKPEHDEPAEHHDAGLAEVDAAAPEQAPAAPRQGDDGGALRGQVAETIEAIRPAVQADGGDLILVGVDEATGVVDIELVGACVGCPASTYTLKAGIERILKDRVEGVTEVNALGMDPAFG